MGSDFSSSKKFTHLNLFLLILTVRLVGYYRKQAGLALRSPPAAHLQLPALIMRDVCLCANYFVMILLRVFCVIPAAQIWLSYDAGLHWQITVNITVPSGMITGFNGISMSSTGQYMAALYWNNNISVRLVIVFLSFCCSWLTNCLISLSISSDYGITWTNNVVSPNEFYNQDTVAVSGSGQYMYAVDSTARFYKSSDFGVTWSAVCPTGVQVRFSCPHKEFTLMHFFAICQSCYGFFEKVKCDETGQMVVFGGQYGVFVSNDFGS